MCKQGWLLGTWLGGLKDLKATIQEVHGNLEDKVIIPESGGRPHAFPFFAFCLCLLPLPSLPVPLPWLWHLPLPLNVYLASFTTCTRVCMPGVGSITQESVCVLALCAVRELRAICRAKPARVCWTQLKYLLSIVSHLSVLLMLYASTDCSREELSTLSL